MVHLARVGTYWVSQITHDSQWRPPWEHLPGQEPPPAQGGFQVLGTPVVGAAVDVPETMQRRPADFSRNAWFDSEYMYCVCFLGRLGEFPYFLSDGVLGS